ncbi:uncharacterized protein LOC131439591 [Malaya genurostris]|uniref:uncharacterized protein LOC131439591 n=1 Tax=Malaya genurostris TaxID=325434 RepID=UPI0026F38087|nr:uncharacterized protein LOC131439591 [Malaya genurostris]
MCRLLSRSAQFLAWIVWIQCVSAFGQVKHLLCRIDSPSKVRDCSVLKDCIYRVYPPEAFRNSEDLAWMKGCNGLNNLLSAYSGEMGCKYFAKLISTSQGREDFVTIVERQLMKSSFRGLDLRCDPTVYGAIQIHFNSCLRLLRKRLRDGYIIVVHIENTVLDPMLIDTLNTEVDLVSCSPQNYNFFQGSNIVPELISRGCDPQKIIVDIPFPTITCPLNIEQLLSATNSIKKSNLFGVVAQIDRDDVSNACGNGTFPLLRRLSTSLTGYHSCEFEGFKPDPRNRSRFYSCFDGVLNLHQCPRGQLFDPVNNTCIAFVRVNCNAESCSILGPVHITNDTNFVPIMIPVPKPCQ